MKRQMRFKVTFEAENSFSEPTTQTEDFYAFDWNEVIDWALVIQQINDEGLRTIKSIERV